MHSGKIAGVPCLALLTVAGVSYAASINKTDKQFMVMAATLNMTQAHEGQMAEKQANRTDVRSFGQSLDQDHKQAYTELSRLASKTGVTIPTSIVARNRDIEQLDRLKGKQFDSQFARDEVSTDQRALTEFKREAKQGQDPDVKAYASKMIPVIEKHLHDAQACAKPEHRG